MTTEPDFFVKQGDFQSLAAGRPMLYYRDPSKALVDWERGWRDYFAASFPASVEAIDKAVGWTGEAAETAADAAEAADDTAEGEPSAG